YVGYGEQVERRKPAFGSDHARKLGDDFRVAKIPFLGHRRHHQVLSHQELNKLGVVTFDSMVCTKTPRVDGAERGMIAATTFGDVVEQSSNIKQPVAVEVGHELAGERIFLSVFGHSEAAQVSDHHQRVLIDRVSMK